jgi:hypothetical protein
MSTTQCSLFSSIADKCRINPPDYAMLTLVIVKSDKITVLLMKASLFHGTYLRCDWWFIDKWMRVILHNCCQTQSTISGLRYVKSGPGKIQYNYNSAIQAAIFNWPYIRRYLWYVDNSMRVILHISCQIKRVSSCYSYVNNGPGQIKFSYISCYSGINIQMNVSRRYCWNVDNSVRVILHICSQI